MNEVQKSLKQKARIAGIWYLLLAIAGSYTLLVRSQTIVRGDAQATMGQMLENEFLFRTGVTSSLTSSVLFIFLVFELYRLFEGVDEYRSRLMVALVLVQVPISFVIETFNITALMVAKAEVLKMLSPGDRQDTTLFLLKMNGYGVAVVKVFWGLWLVPLGQLVYRSNNIPKALGILLIIGGVGYVLDTLTFLLWPEYRGAVARFALLHSLGEILMILWLLIRGVSPRNAPEGSTA